MQDKFEVAATTPITTTTTGKLMTDILEIDGPAEPSRLWRSNESWMPIVSLRRSCTESHSESVSDFHCYDKIRSYHILTAVGGFCVAPPFWLKPQA